LIHTPSPGHEEIAFLLGLREVMPASVCLWLLIVNLLVILL
jgi:hypothetical protein